MVCVEDEAQTAGKLNERRPAPLAAALSDCEQSVNRICSTSDPTV
jgi:hypothetical protein